MKKAFTAEQISGWFTSGTTFANIKLAEEVVERKRDEPSSKETRYQAENLTAEEVFAQISPFLDIHWLQKRWLLPLRFEIA